MGAIQQVLAALGGGGGGAGAAPDTITGCTLWVDFTDATKLFTNNKVTNVSADGDLIQFAQSKVAGTVYAIHQTTGSAKPTYKTAIRNGQSVGRMDGTGDSADVFEFDAATPANGVSIALQTAMYGTGAKTLIVALAIPDAAADSGQPYGNSMITGDGATLRSSLACYALDASNLRLQWYNFDGSVDAATQDVAKNSWNIVSCKHDGTDLKIRVNHGSWATAASGATNTMTGPMTFGHQSASQRLEMDCAHFAVYNAAVSDSDIYLVEQYMADQLAITLS